MIKTTIFRDKFDVVYKDENLVIFAQCEPQQRKYCVKQAKQKHGNFMYYLCDVTGISASDSYVYSSGTLLGISDDDLREGDITLTQ